MDLLSLVQWLGCLAALGGGTVVAWLAEPVEVGGRAEVRRRTALAGAALLLVAFLGWWWFGVDLDADDLSQEAGVLAGAGAGLSVVFLVLLLAAVDDLRASGWPTYRRAAGVMMAGFGTAAAASLQVALVGERWAPAGWLALAGFVVAIAVVVLAQPAHRGLPDAPSGARHDASQPD